MCGNYTLILVLFTTIVVRLENLEPIYGLLPHLEFSELQIMHAALLVT